MSISVKNFLITATVCTVFAIAGMVGVSVPAQAQSLPGLTTALESQLTPMIQNVYRQNPTQLEGVMAFLERYVTTADRSNTKRKMAADIHMLIQKIQNPSQIPTLTDAQIETLLMHLPATPRDREVLILEFSDLQCPFCKRHSNNGTLDQVASIYPTVRPYFFDFPLSFHAQANPGAVMRQCVQRHAGYTDMKGYVENAFETAFSTSSDVMQSLYNLGFDDELQSKILDCYDNLETQKGVDSQMALGQSLGVTGTPGNVVVDRYTKAYIRISGAVPASSFDTVMSDIANGNTNNRGQTPIYIYLQPSYMGTANLPSSIPQPAAAIKLDMNELSAFKNSSTIISGNEDAKVSIIEFSDFQCPFCQRHSSNGTLEQVQEKYGNDVNVYFGHFPLGFHANAQMAGEALECAGAAGGDDIYRSFKTDLFAAGGDSRRSLIDTVATDLGLDMDVFANCLDTGIYEQLVKDQMAYGQSLGVTGTPGNIVINNNTGEFVKVSGAVPAGSFDASISNYLK